MRGTEIEEFQDDVRGWMLQCFGKEILSDKTERIFRFVEESLELAQSMGLTKEQVSLLVDYVFNRPTEEQYWREIGGVMVTLAALCVSTNESLEDCANKELERCTQNIEKIRAKHQAKTLRTDAKINPLPGKID